MGWSEGRGGGDRKLQPCINVHWNWFWLMMKSFNVLNDEMFEGYTNVEAQYMLWYDIQLLPDTPTHDTQRIP